MTDTGDRTGQDEERLDRLNTRLGGLAMYSIVVVAMAIGVHEEMVGFLAMLPIIHFAGKWTMRPEKPVWRGL